jgi:DMSO/TMAO reductase YedYZ molybdopterin-dependent catalytic subunit
MAGPSPGATHVRVIASDGFAGVAALEEFRRLGLLLLRSGEGPLREEQGGPLRLVMPGSANPCASVKRVVAIEVREGPFREASSNHPDVPMVRKG